MLNLFPFRLTIIQKLFFWSLTIIVIFLLTTIFLFFQIENIVDLSHKIVDDHYRIVNISEEMIDQLILMIEYEKRYDILQKEDDKKNYFSEFSDFKKNYQELISLPVIFSNSSSRRKLQSIVQQDYPSSSPFLKEEKLNSMIETISSIRDAHRTEIASQLHNLNQRGNRALQIGLYGLIFSIFVGLLGSFLLSYLLYRSMRELKRGIQRVSEKGILRPIRVYSKDELGEVSEIFNKMTDRLKKEEQKRADFISMLSHEIRTPLTSIRESLNLLREGIVGNINEQQKNLITISSNEVERLSSLLKRLMYVSQLDSKDLPVKIKPCNVASLLEGTVNRLLPAAQSKEITFKLQLEEDEDIQVMADIEQIQQVMVNLVGNSIKFSPENSKIVIGANRLTNSDQILFSIQDEGPGIPFEDQDYVFDKYYRGLNVQESLEGTGLGLHISKKIIMIHGGDLWLKSNRGQGSIFYFTLPEG